MKRYTYEEERTAMVLKTKTQQAQEAYKLWQQIVELVVVDIKDNKRIRAFLIAASLLFRYPQKPSRPI